MWALIIIILIILIYFGKIGVTRVNDVQDMRKELYMIDDNVLTCDEQQLPWGNVNESYMIDDNVLTCDGRQLPWGNVNESYLVLDGKVKNEQFCGGDVSCDAGCGPGKCFGCRSVWDVNGKKCSF